MLQNYIDIYRGIHVLPTFKQLFESIQLFWDRDWTEVSIHRFCGHFVSCQKINSQLKSLQGLAVIQKQTPEKENQTPKADICLVIPTNTSVKHSDSWIPVSSSQTPVSDIHDFDTCVWESDVQTFRSLWVDQVWPSETARTVVLRTSTCPVTVVVQFPAPTTRSYPQPLTLLD